MAVTPKLEQLDPELRAAIDRLCNDRKLTVDQLFDAVKQMGVDVSRASVGRYRKDVRDVGQLMIESRDAAKALREQLGDLDDDDQSRLNNALLQGQLFRLQMKLTSGDIVPDDLVGDLRKIADTMYRSSASRKMDAERVTKARREATEQTLKAVDKELKASGQPGLTKEQQERLWDAVGVPVPK